MKDDEKQANEFGFEGRVVRKGEPGYEDARLQYATTSFPPPWMSPQMILYAAGESDVFEAIKLCREKGMKLAIRTGGHQYSGFSSTKSENMQVDVSTTYPKYEYEPETNTLTCGVSQPLGEWAQSNNENGIFLPMGICEGVHLGGHVCTGGYGMLARSYGLLADHVKAFDILLADGKKHHIERPVEGKTTQFERDLFYAVLGGSSGSYGAVTQWEFTPMRDTEHPNSACYLFAWLHNKERLRRAVSLMTEYNQLALDGKIPSDYEFMLTISSSGKTNFLPRTVQIKLSKLGHMKKNEFGETNVPFPVIQLWALYTNKGGEKESFDDQWFERFVNEKELGKPEVIEKREKKFPVSRGLAEMFIVNRPREFEYPFIKHVRATNNLVDPDGWANSYTDQAAKILGDYGLRNGLHLMSQIQVYGGGALFDNDTQRTESYSWRDMTIGIVYDIFYDKKKKEDARVLADNWQQDCDKLWVGERGLFAKRDMRVFWGTFGERDLKKIWHAYYESSEMYERSRQIKGNVDPDMIFNPDLFAITPPDS